MKEIKIDNPDKFLKKITNLPIMGYASLIVTLLGLGFLIFGIIDIINNSAGIVFIIVGFIISIVFFLIFNYQKNKVKRFIKEIDLDKVKKELTQNVVGDSFKKTYFTKNYMLTNFYYGFIVDYKDILLIYERVLIDPNTLLPRSDLAVCLKNGRKEFTEYKDLFVDEIIKHNNKVLVGKDKIDEYKVLVKKNNG